MNFFEQVYQIVKQIPGGKVMTYGQIAEMLGTKDARRVGHALHANKDGVLVPCHRVVNKDGRLAPGFAFGGFNEQKKRLEKEGVVVNNNRVDLKQYGHKSRIFNLKF
jgi:methylated-DNA-protein-cysteine methyltransferase-like protein